MKAEFSGRVEQPMTVVFFGPSGSGKGTQAALLEEFLARHSDNGVLRLEMGERLRECASGSDEASKRVNKIMSEGGLLPSFIPSHIMTTFFLKEFTGEEHLIFDGVARRIEQAKILDDALSFYDRSDYHIISLELSEREAHTRMQERHRDDDAEAQIRHRFEWYKAEVLPALEELKKRNRTMHTIDGQPSVEEIHKNILTVLGLTS
jgi:adenylate kinase